MLYKAARDHAKLPADQLLELEHFSDTTRGSQQMGERTARRLEVMSDSKRLDQLLRLPDRLLAIARKRGKLDATSAGHVRAALFLLLLIDTAARLGNIVELDLTKHFFEQDGRIFIIIPGDAVKNGQEIRTPVRPRTARALRHYRDSYRAFHAGGSDATWLFPRPDGTHWTITAANETLQDLTARHIGFPVNPHLVRALVGEIIEQDQPGAIGLTKDILGHKQSSTTEITIAAIRNSGRGGSIRRASTGGSRADERSESCSPALSTRLVTRGLARRAA